MMFRRFAAKLGQSTRGFATQAAQSNKARFALAAGATGVGAYALSHRVEADSAVDYASVKKDIAAILDQDDYDDGSLGPIFIRLAWHASGTYDIKDKTGGSNGATMRFSPEADHGANAGLHVARNVLESIKKNHPGISYGDLWTLASVVAIEEMGGPSIPWYPGRKDAGPDKCTPDGRLPDAALGAAHLRDIFYKMGLNDQEIVALSGAHTFGRCHTDRSGFWGPWTRAPTTFSNLYFQELLNNKWTVKKWGGPKQFEDPTGELMMLPTDMCLLDDPAFRKWVDLYAVDEDKFAKDFSKAYSKLISLGVAAPETNWGPILLIGSLLGVAVGRAC